MVLARGGAADLGLSDEAVHPAAMEVADIAAVGVRPAVVLVGRVVVRALAAVPAGIGQARHLARVAGEPGEPVGAGIRAEVGVERAVLLHDDHDVADLVDPVAVSGPGLVPMTG